MAARATTRRPTARATASRRPRAASDPAPVPDPALRLDRLVHERIRLGMLSALAVTETLSFSDLKRTLEATDGNISVHARKLEEAGYVECSKSFVGRVPRTEYRLTDAGRRALEEYLDRMETLIRSTRRR